MSYGEYIRHISYSDNFFLKTHRMSKSTYIILHDKVKDALALPSNRTWSSRGTGGRTALSTDERLCIVLRYLAGSSNADICMQMKCSPSTVDVSICRGLEVLCDQLRSTLINPTDPAEVAAAYDLSLIHI